MGLSISPADQAKLLNAAKSAQNASVQSNAEAIQLAQEYMTMIEMDLKATMKEHGYKPGGSGRIYGDIDHMGQPTVLWGGRTGRYGDSTKHSAVTIQGNQAVGTVGYAPYNSPSFLGQGSVDLHALFEKGYRVKPGLSFSDKPYFGWRTGWHIMEMVYNRWSHVGAAKGVHITFNP